MTDLHVAEFDAKTGITIERQLTEQEIAERSEMAIEESEREAQAQAKAAARESALAKLAALGLTQEEIGAL